LHRFPRRVSKLIPEVAHSQLVKDSTLSTLDTRTTPQAQYIHTPPSHAPICGPLARERGERDNLWTKFLDIRLPREREEVERMEECYGVVLERPEELCEYIHSS